MNVFIALKGSHFWFLLYNREQLELFKVNMNDIFNISIQQINPEHKRSSTYPRRFKFHFKGLKTKRFLHVSQSTGAPAKVLNK